MKHSEFWVRMEHHLGVGYARVWADTQVIGGLRNRTALEALDSGELPKVVWRAVHAHLGLPATDR